MPVSKRTILRRSIGFVTARHLTIRGSNLEIGQSPGQLARERQGHQPSRYVADPKGIVGACKVPAGSEKGPNNAHWKEEQCNFSLVSG